MNSSEIGEIAICLVALVAVYILTRHYHAWRMARAYKAILKDLEKKGAVDPSSAVELPYARQNIFRMGTRDFLPKMLQYMTANSIVGVTDEGRYYTLRSGVGPKEL